MLLVIDVGNTNTGFAVYGETDWIARWRSSTESSRTADDYAVWLGALMRMEGLELSHIKACIVSSVVPQAKFNFR
ncbi:MAG: type III pantothenate kinase, partial [Pseudomonadota bacterium]